jgi:hypothetical protein
MAVPNIFGSVTAAIPLSQLDTNFATAIILGNTSVVLGNTYSTISNLTLTNVTISSTSAPIAVSQGGTGLSNIAANNLVLGNSTSSVQVLAPGTSGNVATSNGTTWTSAAATALSSKLLAATRDMTLATGNVSYTGVGFKPTCLHTFAANTTSGGNNSVNGFCDSALGQASLRCTTTIPGNFVYLGAVSINLGTDGATQTFAVTSFDADGFTGTWTKTGAPGGTQNLAILCFK